MKIVIAEDEPLARDLLRALLAEAQGVELVGEAATGDEAVELCDRLRPDVVFLDIDMPGSSGIHAAHELKSRLGPEIVFVTAHELHAVDAFELGAVDYVLKPVRRPRLATVLERIRARLREKERRSGGERDRIRLDKPEPIFWVRTRQGNVRVPVGEIEWIEAARDHVHFHTEARSYLYRTTMAELEPRLQGSGLARVQRSAFVRLSRVKAILREGKAVSLELESGACVPVGPTYQEQTLARLADPAAG